MPKFEVTLTRQVCEYYTTTVEAEDKEEAKEVAWDEAWATARVWTSKTMDSSTYAKEIE